MHRYHENDGGGEATWCIRKGSFDQFSYMRICCVFFYVVLYCVMLCYVVSNLCLHTYLYSHVNNKTNKR